MGGCPEWTLWGMAGSVFCALFAILLAFLAQSPGFLHRYRLIGSRFAKSARRLTGLGLAALLLSVGFFLAGVPLIGTQATELAEVIVVTASPTTQLASAVPSGSDEIEAGEEANTPTETPVASTDEDDGSETGAFSLPDTEEAADELTRESDLSAESQTDGDEGEDSPEEDDEVEGTQDDDSDSSEVAASLSETATPEPTNTVRAEPSSTTTSTPSPVPSRTPTPSPSPTTTPTITLTPTQIAGDTVTVSILGSLTWIYRVPGNQRVEIVYNQDTLILENGRAYQGGLEWQQIRTVGGTLGWIESNLVKDAEALEAERLATQEAESTPIIFPLPTQDGG